MELAEDSPVTVREFLAARGAVTLATAILTLDQFAFRAAFRKSRLMRAKLGGGATRNAVVVLWNAEAADDTGSDKGAALLNAPHA